MIEENDLVTTDGCSRRVSPIGQDDTGEVLTLSLPKARKMNR